MSAEPDDLIQAPGTAEELWRAWPRLHDLEPMELGPVRSAVVVAAHPDDEVLGLGGTLAMLAASSARLLLVMVTDGEASHPGSRAVSPAGLAAIRRAETEAGLAALGAGNAEVIRLGLPDSGVEKHAGDLLERLRPLVDGFDLCAAPWSRDAHPDHEAAGRAAQTACVEAGTPFVYYPVWMWHWARPDDARVPWNRAARIGLPTWALARKRQAIACQASQVNPLGERPEDAAILPPEELDHFTRDFETVLR
ncbi:MAG TPA: PIG-L family deacetylase [Actinocrinis sp.]|nr:PIG-L family deacetylase [Actinocrinis sp.]